MVIQGQGRVGSLCMQAAKAQGVDRVIGIDALPLRCELARELGIDAVIDASAEDPIAKVLELTDGQGAEIVVEAVGGRAGAAPRRATRRAPSAQLTSPASSPPPSKR